MITRITARGIGPHHDTTVTTDPVGVTHIRAPSEWGKSALMDAMCYALWGFGRDGRPLDLAFCSGEEVRAEVETAKGSVLRRTMTIRDGARGAPTREMVRAGEARTYKLEEEWAASLGKIGKQPAHLRLAVVPFSWRELAQGAGGGRPLRDALIAMLPRAMSQADAVRRLMEAEGHTFDEGRDTFDLKKAESLRAKSGQGRDDARAAAEALRDQLHKLGPEPEAYTTADADRAIVAAGEAWTDYGHRQRSVAQARKAAEDAAARRADWQQRRDALGERPAGADVSGLREALAAADAAVTEARKREREAQSHAAVATRMVGEAYAASQQAPPVMTPLVDSHALQAARSAYDAAVAEVVTDTCPTCQRDGWAHARDEHTARVERLAAALRKAEAEQDAAHKAARKAHKEAVAAHEAQTRQAAETLQRLQAEEAEAIAAAEAAQAALAAAEAAADAARTTLAMARSEDPAAAYDEALRALGPCPIVQSAPVEPTAPAVTQPLPADVDAARARLQAGSKRDGERQVWSSTHVNLTLALQRAEQRHEVCEAEWQHYHALVSALRAEPSETLRAQLATLGDLGPVSLVLPEGSGGCEVMIDGRPWYCASTGRQIVADVWLRDAMRRAMGVTMLPIFIDEAQSVAGQHLPTPAPCIVLHTEAP